MAPRGEAETCPAGGGSVLSYGYDAVSRLTSLADNLVATDYDQTLGFGYTPPSQIASNMEKVAVCREINHHNDHRPLREKSGDRADSRRESPELPSERFKMMQGTLKAKCRINKPSLLGEVRQLSLRDDMRPDTVFEELDVDQIYEVSAIECRTAGDVWLFVHTIEGAWFPSPYPADFFEICDPSLPSGWSVAFQDGERGLSLKRLSFPEWASDDGFYERLIEGEARAVEAYQKWRR